MNEEQKPKEEENKRCQECDFENAVRFGRADWRCPHCGRKLMLEMMLMFNIGIKDFKGMKGKR